MPVETSQASSPEFAEWIANQTPDIWHVVAVDLNYGSGEIHNDVYKTILSHPECDRASAYSIFLTGASGIYSSYGETELAHERLVSGFYKNFNFGFAGMEEQTMVVEAHEYFLREGAVKFSLPTNLMEGVLEKTFQYGEWTHYDGNLFKPD